MDSGRRSPVIHRFPTRCKSPFECAGVSRRKVQLLMSSGSLTEYNESYHDRSQHCSRISCSVSHQE